MEFLLPAFGLLAQLIIIGGIIALVVAAVRRGRRDDEGSRDTSAMLRRVFQYGIAFVALMLSASGITLLLDQVLDGLFTTTFAGASTNRLALGLAMTLVSAPVWLLFWNATQRSARADHAEAQTLARAVYAYASLFVAAAITAGATVALLRQLFQPSGFDPTPIAIAVVWSLVWLFHWRTAGAQRRFDQQGLVSRLYQYVTSSYALGLLVFGVGSVLSSLLASAYDAIIRGSAIVTSVGLWDRPVTGGLSLAIVGAIWWWWHWQRLAKGQPQSGTRQVALYVVAILGGTAITVAAASTILFVLLHRLLTLGAPSEPSLAGIPTALAWVIVGGATWLYHAAVVREEAALAGDLLVAARRTYRYLVAAVGLATLAVGLVTLFGLVIGLLIPGAGPDFIGPRWWAAPTAVALTLVVVGGPLWAFHWFRQQALALVDGTLEREAIARRIFIFAVFGVAILATIGAASAFLFSLFQQILEARLSTDVLDGGKWALGVVFTAGAISGYYWQILREDRAAAGPDAGMVPKPEPERRKNVTVVAGDDIQLLTQSLERSLGYAVRAWQRADDVASPALTEAQIEEATATIRSASAEAVLVLAEGVSVRVIPYNHNETHA